MVNTLRWRQNYRAELEPKWGSMTKEDLEGLLLSCLKVSTEKPLRKRDKYLEVELSLGEETPVVDGGRVGAGSLVVEIGRQPVPRPWIHMSSVALGGGGGVASLVTGRDRVEVGLLLTGGNRVGERPLPVEVDGVGQPM